ncbi:hypothetical protein GIB67_014931 [Kingdonia uniflora]|uniref:Myb/SANT-like domain-containing protein n=1 Tax=Kingdonia uniflora TaxID=39325 RepID=A0A7J7MTI6_9MAGN|nr:hypothetical protein GIB67_014931 [Kingdonia uniflora]
MDANNSFAIVVGGKLFLPDLDICFKIFSKDGIPVISFLHHDVVLVEATFSNTLIQMFSDGRPPLDDIQRNIEQLWGITKSVNRITPCDLIELMEKGVEEPEKAYEETVVEYYASNGDGHSQKDWMERGVVSDSDLNMGECILNTNELVTLGVKKNKAKKPFIAPNPLMDNAGTSNNHRGRTEWTPPMDRYFLDLMLEQALLDQSGFGWDDEKHMVTADSYIWDEYLKEHPEAKPMRTKTLPNYQDLDEICGKSTIT